MIEGRPAPAPLASALLVDTGVWTWVRDRRFPHLAEWFNSQVAGGRILVCDLVALELVRLAPNADRATEVAARLDLFGRVPMVSAAWTRARQLQLALARQGTHRRVPPADLLIAATALEASVPVLHYDRDYERIAAVSELRHRWLVAPGTLDPT